MADQLTVERLAASYVDQVSSWPVDLATGEEVLPEIGRSGEAGMTSAAWAPASDLLCWLRLDGRVSMWRPPAGRPMDLTPNLLEYLQYQTGNTAICFILAGWALNILYIERTHSRRLRLGQTLAKNAYGKYLLAILRDPYVR